MFKRTMLSKSLVAAFSGTAAICGSSVFAQDANPQPQELQRVEITGTAIKRIASEGALPITVLTAADIKKTGATSITELIQNLPAMQGFQAPSQSVNGGGGGVTTASLHSLPSKYTLVLLDGQRVAPLGLGLAVGGGFGVNIESFPIDAVERVEILTDGASALYGSDAIAGVVNFILKKNRTDGTATVTYNQPQHQGGGSWNASLTKGFGNLDTDSYNVLFSLSHAKQDSLQASQRSFSAPGAYFPFSSGGTGYIFNNRSSNSEPANLTFTATPTGSPAGTAPTSYALNPYYSKNGNCGTNAGVLTAFSAIQAVGASCRFNYGAVVEDLPKSTLDTGLLKGTAKINADTTVWSELALSEYKMTAVYAPSAQPLGVSPTSNGTLYNAYIAPYLAANNLTITPGSGKMGYRSVSLGGRADEYKTDARHFAIGIDGSLKGWDYNASLTLSNSQLTDTAAGGYSDANLLTSAIASGAYDPVLGTGTASVASALLNGQQFSKTSSNLNTLHVGAQHDLFNLPGGASILALGGDYSKTHYQTNYSNLILSSSGFSTQPASSDFPIGGNYGQVPFDAARTNWGTFGELFMPVTKEFELTGSVRYDRYSKTFSKYVFNTAADANGVTQQIANADLGNTFASTTGKLSFKYVPIDTLLLRGSYGSGFKAPNISDIAGAVVFGGSTQGSYPCPFPGSIGCQTGSGQYDLLAGPNGLSGSAGLKPETSRQWTLGFRVDPVKSFSAGFDLWSVTIRNQVLSQGIAEQVGFANPSQYSSLFINPYQDPAGFPTIGFQQLPFNGGQAVYKGIDWDLSYSDKFAFGNLVTRWTGTYILKQQYNFGEGQPFNTDLGVFGPDQQVVFRTTMNFSASLQTGPFANTVVAHYKSGYRDESYTAGTAIFLANPDGSLGQTVAFAGLKVPSYTTFDWQGKFDYSKSVSVTLGVKNLFDRNPPLSLQSGGGGNALGFDGRYTDPIGRTYYVAAQYKF